MFYKFLYPLVKYFSGFNIFRYITFRAVYAAITALLISFLLGPVLIKRLKKLKLGQEVRADGPKTHLAKSGIPTMGGILIILSVLISVILWQDLDSLYTWLLLLAVAGFGLIGFIDDYIKIIKKDSGGLKARFKLIGQFVISLIIVVVLYLGKTEHTTLLYLPFIKNPVMDLSFYYIPISVVLLMMYSNAVNFTDGLDGLASGLVIFIGITFAVLSYLTGRVDMSDYLNIPYIIGSGELTIICSALFGAAVGFLWFNTHPAEVMMGDTGSLALGGVIGVIALIIKKEILLIITGGVFVMEIFSVIIQVAVFKLTKKRVFKMAPLHHHFELKGWKESKVVIRLWILGGLFALLSLSTLKIQ
ncbi:MAG: phospho-N-acetylmuramoyl-pentapeptide-transferase [Spirochaetales bacterium]|nr:phospho-N-acetylmuramoyl-pentapeptide-transferase [Spirochaetales bacterium]